MSAPPPGPRLHASIARMADLLLGCSRFGSDALLIGADAFTEIAAEADIVGQKRIAYDARALADRLRNEAPNRVRPSPCPLQQLKKPATLLEHAMRAQREALLAGERITSGEALLRGTASMERSMHVPGGAQ